MSIYIQVENIHDGHSKRFGPYEAVSPGDLQVDEGTGWTGGPVQPVWSDTTDDDGEPYSWVENVRVEGEDPTYWHNCYIVEDRSPTQKFADSVFGQHDDPYTDNPTMLRISREHNGDWTLDGINDQGKYTEATISYETLEGLLEHVEEFIDAAAPGLKDAVTYETHYLPIAHVTHDEQGNIIAVEINWDDSQNAVEQTVDEGTAENLGLFFDKWLKGQPQAEGSTWRWEVDNDG